jgi:hypothetical protein
MPGVNSSGAEQDEATWDAGQQKHHIMGSRDPQAVAREQPAGLQ